MKIASSGLHRPSRRSHDTGHQRRDMAFGKHWSAGSMWTDAQLNSAEKDLHRPEVEMAVRFHLTGHKQEHQRKSS